MREGSLRAQDQKSGQGRGLGFKPLWILLPVLLVPLAMTRMAEWRQQNVLLPRYCDQQQATIEQLRRVLTESEPAGGGSRKPYIIAAKLLFLNPRQGDESVADYLARMRNYLRRECP
ncbi:MAG: hypothetical protein U9Q71_05180 [Pseudomonadota bacterium]|nr:hypothetical protein [Pseudomonadota bacterium]